MAAAGGIISGLMYNVGVHAGVNTACQSLAEKIPEEEYVSTEKAENN